jgi:hypothetical protein
VFGDAVAFVRGQSSMTSFPFTSFSIEPILTVTF